MARRFARRFRTRKRKYRVGSTPTLEVKGRLVEELVLEWEVRRNTTERWLSI